MASVVKRKLKSGFVYYVSYRAPDKQGLPKQHWIRCNSEREAEEMLPTVRAAEKEGHVYFNESELSFIAKGNGNTKKNITVTELLEQYVAEYGVQHWQSSTLFSHQSIIQNYIVPFIGNIPVYRVTARLIQEYYNDLPHHKARQAPFHKAPPKNISARTVKEIHKILRPALKLAVRDGVIEYNPALSVLLPPQPKYKRSQWTGEELKYALSICDDELLYLCMSLVFACSLRTCELAGLTWDCVHINEESLADHTCRIDIKKELRRINKQSMKDTGERDIIKKFPAILGGKETIIVLKALKTEASTRSIYLPDTVARFLVSHKARQQKQKEFLQGDYHDYGMVVAQDNGNPYEGNHLSKRFTRFVHKNNLREVVFYSLRHSSATEKLRQTHDVKSVQGDLGHARADMTENIYAGILDESRMKVAMSIDQSFFKDIKPKVALDPKET